MHHSTERNVYLAVRDRLYAPFHRKECLFSSKGSFICTIPQKGMKAYHTFVKPVVVHLLDKHLVY